MAFLESILIGVSIAAIPGPVIFEIIRRTLTKGFWAGAFISLGAFAGYVIVLSLIFFGVSSFLTTLISKAILYFLSAAIMFWLGFSTLKLKKSDIENKQKTKSASSNSIIAGFSIAAASPIVIAFWISLSGSYLAEFPNKYLAFANILSIAIGFMLFHFPLAAIVNQTKQKIPAKYILPLSKLFGAILIAFGVSFLYRLAQIAL